MFLLVLGLIVFIGSHGFTTLRPARAAAIGRLGEGGYKAAYTVVALIGLVLIARGFGQYRAHHWHQLWTPPDWTRHITITLMWFAFVALAASGPRPSRIRGWLRHPMLVAVKLWALAHLIANGDAGGVLLFGSLLAWAVYDRIAVKRRGDLGAPRLDHFTSTDGIILALGTVAYAAMIWLHPLLIGVAVFRWQ